MFYNIELNANKVISIRIYVNPFMFSLYGNKYTIKYKGLINTLYGIKEITVYRHPAKGGKSYIVS